MYDDNNCCFIIFNFVLKFKFEIANPLVKFGINCYGYKPKITEEEQQLMNTTPPYPQSAQDIAFQKRVDFWKGQVDNVLVSPFNHQSWGSF